jgi:hypothetical protein
MIAFEQGRASAYAEIDAEAIWDDGHNAGYQAAVTEWEDFLESMPDHLWLAVHEHILTIYRFQAEYSTQPPF